MYLDYVLYTKLEYQEITTKMDSRSRCRYRVLVKQSGSSGLHGETIKYKKENQITR